MTRRLWFSCIALGVTLVVGLTYALVALIQVDPRHPPYQVTLELPYSGGLLERSNVSLRGTVVGRVKTIDLDDDGVVVTLNLDDGTRIARDTDVIVGALSVAGEQYVDFRPRTTEGPVLADGDDVRPGLLTMPVPFSKLLGDLVTFADSLDPKDVQRIGRELALATGGSGADLAQLFDNSTSLMATLDQTLPDTLGLLDNSARVLDMMDATSSDLETIASSSRKLAAALRTSDPSLRVLLDEGPRATRQFNGLLGDLRTPMNQLLRDGQQLFQILAPRAPALAALFPAIEFGAGRGAKMVNTGAIRIFADLVNQGACRYHTPLRSPTIGGNPGPYLYAYCDKRAPHLLQRGPYYAPRPAGDDTWKAPPGVTGDERGGPRP